MKSLRQLLRHRKRTQSGDPSPQRREVSHSRAGETRRRLSTQALEQRQLLAADFEPAHNYWNDYDVNQDLKITPSDALTVINYLATDRALGEQVSAAPLDDPFVGKKVDVNEDGQVTPSDALSVINALARGEQMSHLVELYLTARDANDNLLPETGGVIQVDPGQENSFFLEVAYDDERVLGGDLGAFSIFPDIGVSQGGLLKPVLRETQQVIFSSELINTTSGNLVIGREGTSEQAVIPISSIFNNGLSATFRTALVDTFGLDANDFDITEPAALKGEAGNDFGVQIFYSADAFGNVDIPDLIVTNTFDNNVTINFREFAPFEADGTTPNSSAVRFNLDVRSRTLNNNQKFYSLLNRGNFNSDTGFFDIGGVGGAFPRGVRDVDANGLLIEPFDAFRIEVYIDGQISNSNPLVVDVNPGEGVDPLTLYGSNEVVTEDLILLDEDSRVTFSTGAVINNPPILGTTPLSVAVSEDDPTTNIDLLQGASDPDNDTITVEDFAITGNVSGISRNGSTLTVDPSAYNSLKVGQSVQVVATYTVSDGQAGSPTQTLTVTINGANDPPVVTGPITETRSENASQFSIDLLQNSSDPDGDPLDAINISLRAGSDDPATGVTVDDNNNELVVTPAAYSALEDGESLTFIYDFTVSDGNGGNVASSVTITINGDTPNRDPVVSGPVTASISEDDPNTTVSLLDNVTDPDTGDVVSVQAGSVTLVSGDDSGIVVNGNNLEITPSAYNSLAFDETEVIAYTYTVIDGEGGSVAHSATITINGANDAPQVAGPLSETVSEDDSTTSVDLLSGATDPDLTDTLDIANLTNVSGSNRGISGSGSSLTIDPSAYNDLADGESETVIYSYDVIDNNGGVTPQSLTITINGVNDAPTVDDAVTLTVSEDDNSASVDLLTGASDPDTSDTLSVDDLTTVSGNSDPFTVDASGVLSFDPNAYNSLADGESEIVVLSYDVIDGKGGSASQSATITINGANDAPTVSAAITRTYAEDDPSTTISLLENASDPDASDVLSVANVVITGEDTSGVSQSGNDLTINPSAYGDLEDDEEVVITLTYQVTDGTESVNQTATITITGELDVPTVSGPITVTLNENDGNTIVDLLQGASDPNNDPLSVINAAVTSGDASGVTIDEANNRLLIDPSAYADLEDGQQAIVVVDYEITDPEGNKVSQTATITINGQTLVPSMISGSLFIDHIENLEEVRNGATPIRNGVKDDDEQGLGGVTIRLLRVTPNGEVEIDSTLTDRDGSYKFSNVLPGTYFVEYEVPDSIQYTGSTRGQVVIDELGGENETGPALNAIGYVGVQKRLDLLVKTYLAAGIIDTKGLSNGLAGGSAQLASDGTQEMILLSEEFDAKFAEIALNDARDAALLTIIDSNDKVMSARLTLDQFVVTGDGAGVRFFGSIQDFDFVEDVSNLLVDEFDDYRNAIDRAISEGL